MHALRWYNAQYLRKPITYAVHCEPDMCPAGGSCEPRLRSQECRFLAFCHLGHLSGTLSNQFAGLLHYAVRAAPEVNGTLHHCIESKRRRQDQVAGVGDLRVEVEVWIFFFLFSWQPPVP